MPNKSNVPLMNILDRNIPRRGEGFGEWRCRYYCNNDKKTKYISYQYGARTTSDEAYEKVKIKRDELIKILENDLIERKKQKEIEIANKPPLKKRGRKPLPPEVREERKPKPKVQKIITVRDLDGNILQATIVVNK